MATIDKYIECENVIIILDLFLHRLEVLRHLLFNTTVRPLVRNIFIAIFHCKLICSNAVECLPTVCFLLHACDIHAHLCSMSVTPAPNPAKSGPVWMHIKCKL